MARLIGLVRSRGFWIAVGLFALALALRLIGADWHGFNTDEDIGSPAHLLAGQYHPQTLYYPPLLVYLTAIADVPLYAIGRIAGWWHNSAGFRDAYFSQPTLFLVTARTVVALCSAIGAPVAYLLARQIRLDETRAALVGLAVALVPGAIFWAHIAKSDSGLGPAFLLAALAGLRLIERPAAIGRAVFLGFAIAWALSLKHSALFLLAPMLLALAVVALRGARERAAAVRGLAIAAAAAVAFWLPLNLHILLYPKVFLASQALQSQISLRPATIGETLGLYFEALTWPVTGLSPPILALTAVLAIVGLAIARGPARTLAALLGTGWLVASLIVLALSRGRQPTHLWLPYVVLLVTMAALGAMLLAGRGRAAALAGYAALALLIAGMIVRIVPILTQATEPSQDEALIAAVLENVPQGAKLAADPAIAIPADPQTNIDDRARDERLAAKYGLVLPPRQSPVKGVPGGYRLFHYRFVFGGLENLDPRTIKHVEPYAWPIQPEEWDFADWRARGIDWYVVHDPTLLDHPQPAYRSFFRTLDRTCRKVVTLPAKRPLFFEQEAWIYHCG
jgi:hypothetical protein